MPLKPPRFWHDQHQRWQPGLLAPLGLLYGRATIWRMGQPGIAAPCPVVCIGNFTLGGAGKTPTAIWMARRLAALGHTPAILSRGYGARVREPIVVDPARHVAADVGDEPLLLARVAMTIVSPDRVASMRLAVGKGATCIILDDGLQNPSLAKDLVLAVIDGASGFGNGAVFPAGPLRAAVADQARFAHAVMLIGDGQAGEQAAARVGLPVINGHLAPDPLIAAQLAGRSVVALAGIGQPAKFVTTLQSCGVQVIGLQASGDHAVFSHATMAATLAQARAQNAMIVTTEKDAARMGGRWLPGIVERLVVLPVTLTITRGDAVLDRLISERALPRL